jgi:hypothetical protein
MGKMRRNSERTIALHIVSGRRNGQIPAWWTNRSHLLERSMGRVREKYNALFAQVAEAVTRC